MWLVAVGNDIFSCSLNPTSSRFFIPSLTHPIFPEPNLPDHETTPSFRNEFFSHVTPNTYFVSLKIHHFPHFYEPVYVVDESMDVPTHPPMLSPVFFFICTRHTKPHRGFSLLCHTFSQHVLNDGPRTHQPENKQSIIWMTWSNASTTVPTYYLLLTITTRIGSTKAFHLETTHTALSSSCRRKALVERKPPRT